MKNGKDPVGSSLPSRVAGLDAKGIFTYYDSDADGKLKPDEFVRALQAAGAAPSAQDFEEACRSFGRTPDLYAFVEALKLLLKKRPTVDSFVEKFRTVTAVDEDGCIDAAALRFIVTQYGEKLSEAEVDDLMRIARPRGSKGQVDIAALGEKLLPAAQSQQDDML